VRRSAVAGGSAAFFCASSPRLLFSGPPLYRSLCFDFDRREIPFRGASVGKVTPVYGACQEASTIYCTQLSDARGYE